MYTSVKDSGRREAFATGAVRDTAKGKGRYDLLPTAAIKRLAQHFENGAEKYGDENWRKGIPLRRLLDSGIRHAFNYLEGQRDEDHLAAAVWNLMAVIETEEMIRRGILPVTLNNLPNWAERNEEKIDEEEAKLPEPDLEPPVLYYRPTFNEGKPRFYQVQRGVVMMRPFHEWYPSISYRSPSEFAQAIQSGEVKLCDADACGTLDGVTPLPKGEAEKDGTAEFYDRY